MVKTLILTCLFTSPSIGQAHSDDGHVFETGLSLLQLRAQAASDSSAADLPYSPEELAKMPLAPYQTKEYGSGIPAGCQPRLVAANKKCNNNGGRGPTYMTGIGQVPRVNRGPGDAAIGSLGIEGEMGWTHQGNGRAWRLDDKFIATGIVGAWSKVNRGDCCNARFAIYEIGGGKDWGIQCEPWNSVREGDHCTELVDAPGWYIFEGATESCGVPELTVEKNPGVCTIKEWGAKEGCQPKLVKENTECSAMDPGGIGTWGPYGPYRRQGRHKLGVRDSVEECVALWASSAVCCGLRFDYDAGNKMCACADLNSQYNWWCQDDRMEPNDPKFFTPAGTGPNEVHSNVYDLSHCVIPQLHDCPADPGAYKADPCNKLLSASLDTIEHSNLGGQGPNYGKDGMLFTDVASLDGESIDLKIVGSGFRTVKPEKNGLSNGIGTFNIRGGTSSKLRYKLIGKNGQDVVVDGLALTFLDMDEGKNGKSRTTVTSCAADHLHVGSELTTSEVDGLTADEKPTLCLSASSTKHGSAANNPKSLDGITEDHKSRAATFLFAAGSEFNVTVSVSKGGKGRNVAFALSPVHGCD